MYDFKGYRAAGYKLLYCIGIIDIVYHESSKKFYEVDGKKITEVKRSKVKGNCLELLNI